MKKNVIRLFAAILLLGTVVFAAPKTLTGTLTDSMCTKGKHMLPGKSDAECIRACTKMGAKWALVSNGTVYLLDGDKAKFDELAGKRVSIQGEIKGNNVTVKTISAVN